MARKSRANKQISAVAAERPAYLAGLYGRLSVEDGDQIDQNSIGNQFKMGSAYLQEHTDIKLVDTYSDNGYTGMNYNRPGFARMLSDLRSHRINCVVVKDISRLGRNFVMTSELVERTFPAMGVRLICINDNFDSIDPNASTISLTLPLKMVMNDYYVKDISRKIRASIGAKMENGEFLPSSSSVPYGYLRNPDKVTYTVDEEPAAIVQRIFTMRSARMSFTAIARVLNNEGIPCPGKLRYLRGMSKATHYENAIWIRGTIRKMTADPVYLGNRIHGKIKRDKVGLDKYCRSEAEWQIIDHAHPAIITQELFDAVQAVNQAELADRAKRSPTPAIGEDLRGLLRDKLVCGDCGKVMYAGKGCPRRGSQIPSWVFFDCRTYRDTQHRQCKSHYINQRIVMAELEHVLNKQMQIAVDVEKLIRDMQSDTAVSKTQKAKTDLYQSLHVRRCNLEAKQERLLMDLAEGLISKEEYSYIKASYSRQIEDLLQQEMQALTAAQELDSALSSARNWFRTLRQYMVLPEFSRELLDALVNRIVVFSKDEIRIELNYMDPIAPILKYRKEAENYVDAS